MLSEFPLNLSVKSTISDDDNSIIIITDDEVDSDYCSKNSISPEPLDLEFKQKEESFGYSGKTPKKRRRSINGTLLEYPNKTTVHSSYDNLLDPSENIAEQQFFDTFKRVKSGCTGPCREKCQQGFTENERMAIHREFWNYSEVSLRRKYVLERMELTQPKYSKVKSNGRRGFNFAYYLFQNGIKVRVCKQFFIDTLDISTNMIRYAWNKAQSDIDEQENNGMNRKFVSADNIVDSVEPNFQSSLDNYIKDIDAKFNDSNVNLFKKFKLKLDRCYKK